MSEAKQQLDVLLVEDRPGDAWAVREVLEKSSLTHRLHTIGSAGEAVAYLRKDRPYKDALDADLVLLSAGLSKGDAAEVLRALTQSSAMSSLPVIVMTDSSSEQDRIGEQFAGASALLPKPFTLDGFISTLKQLEHPRLEVVKLHITQYTGRQH